jgi:hypothetical protein
LALNVSNLILKFDSLFLTAFCNEPFWYHEINVSKLVLPKFFPYNIYLKLQQFYCANTDQAKLTILVESVAYSVTIKVWWFCHHFTLGPKSELPKSDDYAFWGLFWCSGIML